MSLNLCTITGQVLLGGGAPFANGNVIFDPVIGQTVQGSFLTPQTIQAKTDVNGNLSTTNLVQGVFVRISMTQDGNQNTQFTAIVPNANAATFGQLIAGTASISNAVPSAGTWTPTVADDGTRAGGSFAGTIYTAQNGDYLLYTFPNGTQYVFISFFVAWSVSSNTFPLTFHGNVAIFGIPFLSANIFNRYFVGTIGNMVGWFLSSGMTYVGYNVNPGINYMTVTQNGSGISNNFLTTDLQATTGGPGQFLGQVWYKVK